MRKRNINADCVLFFFSIYTANEQRFSTQSANNSTPRSIPLMVGSIRTVPVCVYEKILYRNSSRYAYFISYSKTKRNAHIFHIFVALKMDLKCLTVISIQ